MELLVVFSVVALLVGLLLPALAAAREAARAARCGSHHRQLGIAAAAYAVENGGRVRGWVTTTSTHRSAGRPRDARWWIGMHRQLGAPTGRRGELIVTHVLKPSKELAAVVRGLNCPSIDPGDGFKVLDDDAVVVGGATSAVNRIFDVRRAPNPTPAGRHPRRGGMIRLGDVRDPGALLHFADGHGNFLPSDSRANFVNPTDWSGRAVTPYRVGRWGGSHAAPPWRDRIFWAHPRDASVGVFLDGHVEALGGGLDRSTLDPWNG